MNDTIRDVYIEQTDARSQKYTAPRGISMVSAQQFRWHGGELRDNDFVTPTVRIEGE